MTAQMAHDRGSYEGAPIRATLFPDISSPIPPSRLERKGIAAPQLIASKPISYPRAHPPPLQLITTNNRNNITIPPPPTSIPPIEFRMAPILATSAILASSSSSHNSTSTSGVPFTTALPIAFGATSELDRARGVHLAGRDGEASSPTFRSPTWRAQ